MKDSSSLERAAVVRAGRHPPASKKEWLNQIQIGWDFRPFPPTAYTAPSRQGISSLRRPMDKSGSHPDASYAFPPLSSSHLAPAKLNIRLKITGRRPDGYHELVSIMAPVALYDRLEIRITQDRGIDMSCHGLPVPSDEGNLAARAARAFLSEACIEAGVVIRLEKQIPVAAGLGGGSSDAACVLKALNEAYKSPLSFETLKRMALSLGADVPFFLMEKPCIARGIGEILEVIPDWPELWYVIVTPSLQVSTAWVYGNLNASPVSGELELTRKAYQYIITCLNGKPLDVPALLENDLERVTAKQYPVIGRIKRELMKAGANGALMSGSGPSVFGVFHYEDEAVRAKAALSQSDLGVAFVAQGIV